MDSCLLIASSLLIEVRRRPEGRNIKFDLVSGLELRGVLG